MSGYGVYVILADRGKMSLWIASVVFVK